MRGLWASLLFYSLSTPPLVLLDTPLTHPTLKAYPSPTHPSSHPTLKYTLKAHPSSSFRNVTETEKLIELIETLVAPEGGQYT